MAGQRKESWQSLGGLDISRIYGPDDAGKPPYIRGIHSTMYRSKLWTMRQYAGFGSAEETNERFKLLLERGQKGLSVAFDLPTQLGLDADDELSEGEVALALAFDVTGALSEELSYDIGVSTDIESDGSIDDVDLSFGLDLEGPPLVEDGDSSELSFGASYAILSRELTMDASLSFYF